MGFLEQGMEWAEEQLGGFEEWCRNFIHHSHHLGPLLDQGLDDAVQGLLYFLDFLRKHVELCLLAIIDHEVLHQHATTLMNLHGQGHGHLDDLHRSTLAFADLFVGEAGEAYQQTVMRFITDARATQDHMAGASTQHAAMGAFALAAVGSQGWLMGGTGVGMGAVGSIPATGGTDLPESGLLASGAVWEGVDTAAAMTSSVSQFWQALAALGLLAGVWAEDHPQQIKQLDALMVIAVGALVEYTLAFAKSGGHSGHAKGGNDDVKKIAKKYGVDAHKFGDWLEKYKDYEGIDNDDHRGWKWLEEMVKEYIEEGGK